MNNLSDKQKEFFIDHGFLVLENVIDEKYLSPVIDELMSCGKK